MQLGLHAEDRATVCLKHNVLSVDGKWIRNTGKGEKRGVDDFKKIHWLRDGVMIKSHDTLYETAWIAESFLNELKQFKCSAVQRRKTVIRGDAAYHSHKIIKELLAEQSRITVTRLSKSS